MTIDSPPSSQGVTQVEAELDSPTNLMELFCSTRALDRTSDLRPGLSSVADQLRHHVPFDALAVLLLDERGRELRFEYARGYPDDVARSWKFTLGQGIVGTVAGRGEALFVDDVDDERRFIDAGDRAVSEIAVPLTVDHRVIGVLDVTSRSPGVLDASHLELLSSFAPSLASALESFRLFRESTEQARALELLHELSRDVNASLDRHDLLERVAAATGRLIDFDVFNVLFLDEAGGHLVSDVSIDREGRELGWELPIPLGVGIVGAVGADRRPIRVANVNVDPRYVDCGTGFTVRSELAVPMVRDDRLLGVINLESAKFEAFSGRDEQLLSTLAGAVAVAVENARLYERVTNDERRLAAELEMAREIQQQLLPRSTPWVPGLEIGAIYRPARQLGGDFYDVFSFDGEIGLAVGDVSGKAAAAALYGSLAVGTLRELLRPGASSPEHLLCHLNSRLHRLGIGNRFLAMVYATYEAASRRLRLANSGLPPVLLRRDGAVEELEAVGVPLGLLAGRRYESVELTLRPGDLVAISSDGLEESLDLGDRELGRERLAESLSEAPANASAREVAERLADLADRHADGREPWDDRTVVVLKATATAARP